MISEPLRIRVRGPWACFTRPEFHVERVSYPMMTPSAARGVLEAILMKPIEKPEATKRNRKIGFRWRVLRIGIVNEGCFVSILRNELGHERHNFTGYDISDTKNVKTQRHSLILRDVEYLIEAAVEVPEPVRRLGEPFLVKKYRGMFERRVEKGQCFHRPYLGCREFPCEVFELAPGMEPAQMTKPFGTIFRDFDYRSMWEHWKSGPRPESWKEGNRTIAPQPQPAFFAQAVNGWIDIPQEFRSDEGDAGHD